MGWIREDSKYRQYRPYCTTDTGDRNCPAKSKRARAGSLAIVDCYSQKWHEFVSPGVCFANVMSSFSGVKLFCFISFSYFCFY